MSYYCSKVNVIIFKLFIEEYTLHVDPCHEFILNLSPHKSIVSLNFNGCCNSVGGRKSLYSSYFATGN